MMGVPEMYRLLLFTLNVCLHFKINYRYTSYLIKNILNVSGLKLALVSAVSNIIINYIYLKYRYKIYLEYFLSVSQSSCSS